MDSNEKIKLTKIEAARRQLHVAIRLWFADDDPVAIHALVYAAHEIIHKIYKKKGLKELMFDSSTIKDEYRSEFGKMVKEDANFIKHSNSGDGTETIEFKPGANFLFLCMAITGMDRMGYSSDLEAAFMFYVYLHNPTWFPEDVANERIPVERLDKMRALDKTTFLESYLQVRAEQRAQGLIP